MGEKSRLEQKKEGLRLEPEEGLESESESESESEPESAPHRTGV